MRLFKLRWLYCVVLWISQSNAQQEARGCLGEFEFVLVNDSVIFTQTIDECALRNGTLALLFTQAEQNLTLTLVGILEDSRSVWLGKQSS